VLLAWGMLCAGKAVVHRHGVVCVVARFVLSFSVALALAHSLAKVARSEAVRGVL